jgi:hypothetical protein
VEWTLDLSRSIQDDQLLALCTLDTNRLPKQHEEPNQQAIPDTMFLLMLLLVQMLLLNAASRGDAGS